LVVTFGFVFASPNLYPPDPAIQLSGQSGAMQIDAAVLQKVEQSLDEAGIAHFAGEADGEALLIRLQDIKLQLRAKEVIQATMGGDYIVALNLAPTTPDWLRDLALFLLTSVSPCFHFSKKIALEKGSKT
jgi:preprotein translocase subunit SecD